MVVLADLDRVRADRVVSALSGVSRSRARRLIDQGSVVVAGQPITPGDRLPAGTEIAVSLDDEGGEVEAAPVPFGVAYEDEHLLVIDKPPGVVVHPGAGVSSGTLVSGLVDRYPELGALADHRYGLVHRLDKDTSGLLIVGRSAEVHASLQSMLRRRRIARTYLALVAGEPPAARGTIDAPIGRDPSNPMRMSVDSRGKTARTHYRRLASWPGVTLLEVSLESGRTHQIRVHLAAVGLPVVGDRTYGPRRATQGPRSSGEALPEDGTGRPQHTEAGRRHPADPGRQWLHAVRLELAHPVTGDPLVVESAPPGDLVVAVDRLGPPFTGALPEPVGGPPPGGAV